jgi:hypothetical protein
LLLLETQRTIEIDAMWKEGITTSRQVAEGLEAQGDKKQSFEQDNAGRDCLQIPEELF